MIETWILGAGFSKHIHEDMPLATELSEHVERHIDSGWSSIGSSDSLRELTDRLGGDVERWLTYLLSESPFLGEHERLSNRALGLQLVESVGAAIQDAAKTALGRSREDWIGSLMRRWHANKASLVSLNYDTLVESLLLEYATDPVSRGLPYCQPAPMVKFRLGDRMFKQNSSQTAKLAKLHGSTNWHRVAGTSALSLNPASPIYVSSFREMDEEERGLALDLQPVILPPSFTKSDFYAHPFVRAQWAWARIEIQYCTHLVVAGCSLRQADWDLRNLLSVGVCGPAAGSAREAAVRPKEQITVVDPSEQPRDELQELLKMKVNWVPSIPDLLATA